MRRGYLSFNSDWGKNFPYRMEKERKVTYRYATMSKIPVAPRIISKVKPNFQRKTKAAQTKYSIPDDFIINFDQILLSYVCFPNDTLQQDGSKSASFIGEGMRSN